MTNQEFKEMLLGRSYKLSLSTIKFLDTLEKKSIALMVIVQQLMRSVTSVGANIVEAQASSSKKDFTNFMNHALKSANESCYWFSLLKDSGKVSVPLVEPLLQETKELSKILGSSIVSLRRK